MTKPLPIVPVAATTVLFALGAPALARPVTVDYVPGASSAMDISPDGRWIVGNRSGTSLAYRYDTVNQDLTLIPTGTATAVSDDGSVVVGCIVDPDLNAEVAAMWTEESGQWTSLGYLPDALSCPSRSNAYEVSGDGSVVVGLSWDGCSGRGFVWTEATGMLELEPLANGSNRASVVSADGAVIGGFAQGSFSRTPAMWNGTTTDGMLLDPPNGDVLGEVQGISDDGAVLLGNWDGDAFKWTAEGGMEVVGQGSVIPTWTGIATDIAANGTVVGFDVFSTARQAWIQEKGQGQIVSINNFVTSNGGSFPVNTTPEVITAISLNGRTIIGQGFFNNAWMITIEPDCPGDTDESGEIDFTDLLDVLSAWGPCAGCDADVDGNLVVDFQDLLAVLAGWGPCS